MAEKRAIEVLREAFSRRRKDVTVAGVQMYFTPLTYGDLEAINGRNPKTDEERNLYLLIHKAQDADGKPLFTLGDMHYLKSEVDVGVLREAMEAMYGVAITEQEADDALKNPPASTSDSPSEPN